MRKILSIIFALFTVAALFCSCEEQIQPVAVNAVYLNTTAYEMTEGETFTLEATVSPDNADNKKIIWSSNNASVASVSNGVVTALKEGQTIITATSDDNGKKAECKITVHAKTINVTSISLNTETLTLDEGASETLVATIEPENASNKTVSWTSSNESVATVDENGKVTGIEAGTTTIIVTTEDGGKTATCEVTVIARVSGITLDKTSLTLEEGARETLTATITPSNASNQYLIWESSDTYVATVDAFGQVTAIMAGTATITVTTEDSGKTAICEVTVTKAAVLVTGVSLNTTYLDLTVGDTATLVETVSPSDADTKSVTWSSSNSGVASVTNGVVNAVSEGSAVITVKTDDGGKTATCTVNVTAKAVEQYVDLGLSVLWATCNLGASKPEEYGLYYQWGDTQGYGSDTSDGKYFLWNTDTGITSYKWCNGLINTLTKYNTMASHGSVIDNKTVLDPADDAAHVALGAKWRIPTDTEWTELRENCTWTWTNENGVNGYRVTSKKSGYTGRSIFLPSAGWREYDQLVEREYDSIYWSSILNPNDPCYAYIVGLRYDHMGRYVSYRQSGFSIRPVYGDIVYVSSVSLNRTSLSLKEGESAILKTTLSPSNATEKFVYWRSSATDVATVDASGNVSAVKAGTATITVRTVDGLKTATCSVTVTSPSSGSAQYVDLGLSVKWATCNLGASKPEEYGGYYQWAGTKDVTSTSIYLNWDNAPYQTNASATSDSATKWSKYVGSTTSSYKDASATNKDALKTVLDPEDDAAHVVLGGKWRMPTDAEWTELRTSCTWTWTSVNGINGYKVTSKKSGYTDKSIFLPAAGCRIYGNLSFVGSYGNYWSSSLSTDYPYYAYDVSFYSSSVYRSNYNRYDGLSIRPVSE